MAMVVSAGTPLLDKSVNFLEITDGRDKAIKTITNFLRFLAWLWQTSRPSQAKLLKKISESLSEYRSVNKFFKWLKNVRDARDLVCEEGLRGLGDAFELSTHFADIGYRIFDNGEYLSGYIMGSGSVQAARYELLSKRCQFYAYVGSFILSSNDMLRMLRRKRQQQLQGQKSKAAPLSSEQLAKQSAKEVKLWLEWIKDFADLLRVAPPILEGVMPGVKSNKGFAAIMGVISGASGTIQVWRKCK
eukprot:TRINITY_DN34532_c0_g1_i1.p1 TRINITY_DN34532_c0_g1~~TRINITY_DN34532_c0_g1_i1.p1  ORF type:complete len:245 (-),score=62.06 TRINITY_DN34532_c0_g1_i1:390-1124(-)